MIGLIGGLSWESSAEYYRLINQGVRARRGGVASAHILMWSFDFAVIEMMQHAGIGQPPPPQWSTPLNASNGVAPGCF